MHFELPLVLAVLTIVSSTLASIANTTKQEVLPHGKVEQKTLEPNKTNTNEKTKKAIAETRRKSNARSTSSSSGERASSKSGTDKGVSLDSPSSSSSEENKYKPKSSGERTGWRKWHRKCTQCPDDIYKKWRDPSIKWICAAYQRARRSFKSLCMMHYRNCQDGTMFVKVSDYRCSNDTEGQPMHGQHFFYDYKVTLSDDDTKSVDSKTSSSERSSSSE